LQCACSKRERSPFPRRSKGGDDQQKIVRALDDATEEARKPHPDKAEVGSALKRASDYAKKGEDFAEVVGKK
jgi:hypothetical protein